PARPVIAGGSGERLQRRDPACGQALAVRRRQLALGRGGRPAVPRPAFGARLGGRRRVGEAGQGAQGRQARGYGGARPEPAAGARAPRHGARGGGAAVAGVRRHGARGVVRGPVDAVLPDLPDGREAAGRPPPVAPAQVNRVPTPLPPLVLAVEPGFGGRDRTGGGPGGLRTPVLTA